MFWIAGLVLAAAAGGIGLWWWLLRMGLPRVRGTARAPGLDTPVEIIRDRWGIPHIYAGSLADACYGLGYVHAQDRLWQMELQRRLGAGRLAEIFGPVALDADRLLRRLGLHRAAAAEAEQLAPAERSLLKAYCRGVNAAMDRARRRRPLEMRLLGIRPEPWTPVDTLSWAKVMALFLGHNWEDELLRQQLVERLGATVAARVDGSYEPGRPVITAPGGAGPADAAGELLSLLQAAEPYLGLARAGASNNWVVAGDRTATGRPLLANDPHLLLQLPAIWYEAHLVCPETEVTGCTLPGEPGVVIGHNGHVGWGFTDAFADTADLYLERWHPTEPAYQFDGEWHPARVRTETIQVKGRPPVVETVYETRHGPVLAGGPLGPGPALALRWAALEPGHPVQALAAMNTARNAAAFRDALRHWTAPAMNVVFADTDGNIGYVMAGQVPTRRQGTGLTPVPGWTGEYEWSGWIPFAELPQLWNPETGVIVTANNQVVDGSYPHHITWDYMPGYRAQRIRDLLAERHPVTVQDCIRIQLDVCSLPGREFAGHCRDLEPTDPLARRALRALLDWDGHLTPDSVGGAVYEVMLHHATRLAYGPLLGEELLARWLGRGEGLLPANTRVGRSTVALLRELRQRDAGFFALAPAAQSAAQSAAHPAAQPASGGAASGARPTATPPDVPGSRTGDDPWRDLLSAALAAAVADLRRTLGADPDRWQWGRLHRLQLAHPLSAQKPLHLLFNGPDVPVGGDTSTPNQTAHVPHQPYRVAAWAPSYRQVLDLAALSRSLAVFPGGQSGHVRSRHYLDLFPLWLRGEFHPMLFSRQAVADHAEATLRLEP